MNHLQYVATVPTMSYQIIRAQLLLMFTKPINKYQVGREQKISDQQSLYSLCNYNNYNFYIQMYCLSVCRKTLLNDSFPASGTLISELIWTKQICFYPYNVCSFLSCID